MDTINASASSDGGPIVRRAFYRAEEVAELLCLALPTVYEISRLEPKRLGVERFGRAVRFRRSVVDRIVRGAEPEMPRPAA